MKHLLLFLTCAAAFICESCIAQSSRVYELRLDSFTRAESNRFWFAKIYGAKDHVAGIVSESTKAELMAVQWNIMNLNARRNFAFANGRKDLAEDYRTDQEIELAKSVPNWLEELGPEGQLLVMQHSNREYLKLYAKRKGLQLDSSFLSNPNLKNDLGVSADQYKPVEDELREGRSKAFESFHTEFLKLQTKNLKAVNTILDSRQRRQFKNRFGDPIQWIRRDLGNESFGQVFGILGKPNSRKSLSPKNESVTQEMLDKFDSHEDFEKEKIPVVSYALYIIVRSPFFRREMEITQSQESQIFELLEFWRNNAFITTRFRKQRVQDLLDGKAKYSDDLKEVLLPHQLEWLPTCELQLYTAKHLSSFGLLDPTVIEAFELSLEQQKKLKTLAREYEKSSAKLSGDLKKRLAVVLPVIFARSIKILDARQRERYKLLTGLPIK